MRKLASGQEIIRNFTKQILSAKTDEISQRGRSIIVKNDPGYSTDTEFTECALKTPQVKKGVRGISIVNKERIDAQRASVQLFSQFEKAPKNPSKPKDTAANPTKPSSMKRKNEPLRDKEPAKPSSMKRKNESLQDEESDTTSLPMKKKKRPQERKGFVSSVNCLFVFVYASFRGCKTSHISTLTRDNPTHHTPNPLDMPDFPKNHPIITNATLSVS